MVDAPLETQMKINDHCHTRGIKFIAADVRGVFATMFCDFGDDFTVYDSNGEQPVNRMVSSISSVR